MNNNQFDARKGTRNPRENLRDFMEFPINGAYIDALADYSVTSNDRVSKVVDFTSSQPSPFLRGSIEVGAGKDNFVIIDHFNGTRPLVLNYRTLSKKRGWEKFNSGIIFDSNVVCNLNLYVNNKNDFRRTPRGEATRQLIRQIAILQALGWDCNPGYYMTETLSKSKFSETFPHAKEFCASIFALQTMSSKACLEHDEIIPDPKRLKEYFLRHNGASFNDASANVLNIINSSGTIEAMPAQVSVSYATLLKIGLLQNSGLSNKRKIDQLFDFFVGELGLIPAYEALIGCLHFANKAGKFIPVQKGAKDIRKNLLASAWDLQLMRLPEQIAASSGDEHTKIYYVCTAEKVLQKLGGMFSAYRVTSLKVNDNNLPSLTGFRTELLRKEIGNERLRDFNEAHRRACAFQRYPRRPSEIAVIAERLEQKVMSKFG